MSNEFPTPPEEVSRLAREMELLRSDLQGGLSKLAQMEKRLRAAFPALPQRQKKAKAPMPVTTKSRDALFQLFDELVDLKRLGSDSAFESRLRNLPPEDAVAMAVELGSGKGKNKTSAKSALDGIRGRVNEMVLLGQTRQVAERPTTPSRDEAG